MSIAFICAITYGVYDYNNVKVAMNTLTKENEDFKGTIVFTNKRNIELVNENVKLRNIATECKDSVGTAYNLKKTVK